MDNNYIELSNDSFLHKLRETRQKYDEEYKRKLEKFKQRCIPLSPETIKKDVKILMEEMLENAKKYSSFVIPMLVIDNSKLHIIKHLYGIFLFASNADIFDKKECKRYYCDYVHSCYEILLLALCEKTGIPPQSKICLNEPAGIHFSKDPIQYNVWF